jgi:hypothetical protein
MGLEDHLPGGFLLTAVEKAAGAGLATPRAHAAAGV